MQLSRSVDINAAPADVWSLISDIGNAAQWISGIKAIEVIEPATGPSIVGLKWRETREFMGKDAVEVMWVTEASEPNHYQVRAESHGAVYTSRFELEATSSGTRLTMGFHCQPVSFGARLMWALTGWMAKGAMRKTVDQDLADIKRAVEQAG